MAEPRLATHIWVAAYLRWLGLNNLPAYILAHGDDTAGAVLVKVATLDGHACLYHRSFDLATDQRVWMEFSKGPEPEIDALTRRQRASDPDLWVIEVESRDGRHLLDDHLV